MGQQQSEPIKFRGAYIGEPLSDYMDCSDSKGKLLRDGYKVHGKLCEGQKGSISNVKSKGGFMKESKLEGEAFLFEGSKLVRIVIQVPNDDW